MITTGIVVIAIFSVFAFVLSVLSLIEVKAMQRSTHRLTYINPASMTPANQEFTTMTEEQKKHFEEDFFKNLI